MHSNGNSAITRGGLGFVALWSAAILLIYAIGGYIGIRQLQSYKAGTDEGYVRQAGVPDPGKLPAGKKTVDVVTGIYINSFGEFSLTESGWAADFDIWFRWTGGKASPERFRFVNGEIESKIKIASYARGGMRYERYNVKARFVKFFNPSRFPFSEEALTIQLEDAVHGPDELRYAVDEQDSGINPAGVPGFMTIEKSTMEIRLHDYGSRMGRRGPEAGGDAVRSRLVFTMLVDIPGFPVYMRMSQALFASVAIALIVFFIKPTFVDPRFGLGVGAVFAAVANNIAVQAMLPPSPQVTLVQMAYAASLATIFLTLVQSAISLYIQDTLGNDGLYRLFDKASFAVLLTGYAAVNLALPLAAM